MTRPIAAGTRIAFYSGVLGFELRQKYGTRAAFLSAGGYHHHIGLNTWESEGGTAPPRGHTGLLHLAILYPTRAGLADAVRRIVAAGVPLDGASDHGVSEAVYLRDPDGNGVELYRDRPREQWPHTGDGELALGHRAARPRGPAGRGLISAFDALGKARAVPTAGARHGGTVARRVPTRWGRAGITASVRPAGTRHSRRRPRSGSRSRR
jgi:catechol 2,3-dioxygenase